MPLKLNVGLSRKIGEANYGSRGASVNVETELDSVLVNEPGILRGKIRALFGVVRLALAEELNGGGNGKGHASEPPSARARSNGHGADPSRTHQQPGNGPHVATPSQVRALHAIAHDQGVDLVGFLRGRFKVDHPDQLTIKAASQAIDELRSLPPKHREEPPASET